MGRHPPLSVPVVTSGSHDDRATPRAVGWRPSRHHHAEEVLHGVHARRSRRCPRGHPRPGPDCGRARLGGGGGLGAAACARGRGRRARRGGRATVQRGLRRLRHQPRHEACPAAPPVAAGDRRSARGAAAGRGGSRAHRRGGGGEARVPQPADLGHRLRGAPRRDPRRPGRMGPHPGREPAVGERGVRVGQPDRAADGGQRPGRLRGRPAVPDPRGGRADHHPRVLLQRLRRPDQPPGRIGGRGAPR